MKKLFLIPLIIIVVSALIFGGCARPAPASAPPAGPIKIGVAYALTGPTAETCARMVEGIKFAFEQAGYEVAGRKIEVIVEDTAGLPDIAVDKARKLVEHDKVCMLFGTIMAGATMAVADYASKMEVPHIATVPESLKMAKYKWSFMGGGAHPQYSYSMGLYAYDEMGLRRVTAITMDIFAAHDFLSAFKDAFTKRGGQIIQEQYPPHPCPDFAPYLVALKDADAVVAWFHGAETMRFLTQFHEFGIRKRMPLVAFFHGSFFSPYVMENLPPEVAEAIIGEYVPTPYSSLLETDVNKRYVEAYKKKYGGVPDDTDAAPYGCALAALEALKATGGDTSPEKLRQALLAVEIEAPEGAIRFDPETQFAIKDIYIVKVDRIGGDYVWVPVRTYKGLPPRGY